MTEYEYNYFVLEGCNLVENSTRPDPTVNNFNPTHFNPTRPDIYNGNQKLQFIVTIITTFILQIYYVNVTYQLSLKRFKFEKSLLT